MNVEDLKGLIFALNDTKYNKVSHNSRICCMTRLVSNNGHCMDCIYIDLVRFICKRPNTEKFQRICE